MAQIWKRLYGYEQKVRPYLPFTSLNTVWRQMDKKSASVLDVGCGEGIPAGFIRRRRPVFMVGLDIFLPSIRTARNHNSHDQYIQADVRYLPLAEKSFDIVMSMEVLEHLDKQEGLAFLQTLDRTARRQVIITTPAGKHEQHTLAENTYQEHKYIWKPAELRKLGYKVRGHGLRNLGGMSGLQSPLPGVVRPLIDVLWLITGPVTYYLPDLAGSMVAIKQIKKRK
jgi:2-polyprenyl-3-methyl-5-hydroxy-6-metoxy-1,4-benzoquinol methylase